MAFFGENIFWRFVFFSFCFEEIFSEVLIIFFGEFFCVYLSYQIIPLEWLYIGYCTQARNIKGRKSKTTEFDSKIRFFCGLKRLNYVHPHLFFGCISESLDSKKRPNELAPLMIRPCYFRSYVRRSLYPSLLGN